MKKVSEIRPEKCRFRLRDEGQPYPKSSCEHCRVSVLNGLGDECQAIKRFPVLGHKTLKSIPWELLEPHRENAIINHGQSLEQLARRGGLDLAEIIVIMSGCKWRDVFPVQ